MSRGISVRLLISCLCALLFLYCNPEPAQAKGSCGTESGYYFTNNRKTNPTKGGFVSDGSYVSESVFIAPTASVCGSANVDSRVRLMGNSVIKDEAIVSGNIRVMGNAIIGGASVVTSSGSSPTIIKGWARIMDQEISSGVHGSSKIPDSVKAQRESAHEAQQKKREIERAFDDLNVLFRDLTNADYSPASDFGVDRYGELLFNSDCSLTLDYEGNERSLRIKSYKTIEYITSASFKGVLDLSGKKLKIKFSPEAIDYKDWGEGSLFIEWSSIIRPIMKLVTKQGERKKELVSYFGFRQYMTEDYIEQNYLTTERLNFLVERLERIKHFCELSFTVE